MTALLPVLLLALPSGVHRTEDGRYISRVDGAELVRVEGGEHLVGDTAGRYDERPRVRVRLRPFLIDRTEVTNERFAKFVQATGYQPKGPWERGFLPGQGAHPVRFVTWFDARCRLSLRGDPAEDALNGWRQHASWVVFGAGVVVALLWGVSRQRAPVPPKPDPATAHGSGAPLPPATVVDGLIRRDVAAMGAPFSVYAPEGAGEAATAAAVQRLRALDGVLSPWRPGSELARLVPGGPIVELGADAKALVRRALRLNRVTGGRYEPGKVQIVGRGARPGTDTVFAPGPLLRGHAAQAALSAMSRAGATRAAVVVGDDRYLLGRGDEAPWRVTLAHPRWPDQLLARWRAGSGAVAHANGDKRCRRAVVVTQARDAAATFAKVVCDLGPTEGLRWVAGRRGVEALVVSPDGRVSKSKGWDAVAPPDEAAPSTDSRYVSASASAAAPSMRSAPVPARPGPSAIPDEERSGPLVSVSERLRIDRTEVTNAAYARFLEATRETPHAHCHSDEPAEKDHTPRYWSAFRGRLFKEGVASRLAPFDAGTFRKPTHPVVGVDWWDAYAFARWAGKRLPTHTEWRRAASGDEARRWPWGDTWAYAKANTGGEKWGELDGHVYAAPADAFPSGAAPCGALQMAGNVAEWTADGYVAGGSSRSPPSGTRTDAHQARAPGFRSFDIGFRCAASAPPPAGAIGETSALVLALVAVPMLAMVAVKREAAVALLVTVPLLVAVLPPTAAIAGHAPWVLDPAYFLLGSAALLNATFFCTDPSTTPNARLGGILFGVGAATLGVLGRIYTEIPGAEMYGILVMNLLTPGLDAMSRALTTRRTTPIGPVGFYDRPDGGRVDAVPRGLGLNLMSRAGAFTAVTVARADPLAALEVVRTSGVTGCGGGGFPASAKWSAARRHPGPRVLVVNAQEGEPSTFKDRYLLEHHPERVVAGAAAAAAAIEAQRIHFVGDPAFPRGTEAALQAWRALTDAVGGPLPAFEVHDGPGLYVCGEETALIEFLEGRRSEPQARPPFPTERGLAGQPTVVHNVETLAWISLALAPSASAIAEHRLVTLSGAVRRPGVYEVPLGMPLADVVTLAGGVAPGARVGAYAVGGPSGGLLPLECGQTPLAKGPLEAAGARLGTASVEVLEEGRCVMRAALEATCFLRDASCGRCTPCRVGTVELARIWAELSRGEANGARIDDVSRGLSASICGLGTAAATRVESVMRHWPDVVRTHAAGGRCDECHTSS